MYNFITVSKVRTLHFLYILNCIHLRALFANQTFMNSLKFVYEEVIFGILKISKFYWLL